MVAAPHGLVNHRAGGIQLDPYRQGEHQDYSGYQQYQGQKEIQRPLDNFAIKGMG